MFARGVVVCLALVLGGCGAPYYEQSADKEVYGILEAKTETTLGGKRPFTIDPPKDTLRQRLIKESALDADQPVLTLTLKDALEAAAENSREFQTHKESLYIAALNLTQEKWDFSTHFDLSTTITTSGDNRGVDDTTIATQASASRLFSTGGSIVASFVNSFMKSFTLGQGFSGDSILSLSMTQPILKGFGRRIIEEPLTQAERNVAYAVRSFERYRRELCVTIASGFYGVLRQYDTLGNAQRNLESLKKVQSRNVALGKAGRMSQVQVDQAVQNVLSAEDGLVRARFQLETLLDRFKITLGLPPDIRIALDRKELEKLKTEAVAKPDLTEAHALRAALTRRLDLRNTVEAVEDTARYILVTRDALRTGLDFSGAMDVPTEAGKPLKFDWDNVTWDVSFALSLPVDRLSERNSYRKALINHQARVRDLEAHQDQVKREVRDALRDLAEAVATYEIQANAKQLAKTRVEAAREMLKAGRAETRDVLESQEALLDAQNAVTSALVDYLLAKMRLLRDLEALVLGPEGLVFDMALEIPDIPVIPKNEQALTESGRILALKNTQEDKP